MGKYMIIRKEEYEFMKNETAKSNKQYLDLIRTTNNELETLKDTVYNLGVAINVVLDKLQMTESARKSNAGKIGGLTASLNKEKKENEELQSKVKDLEVKLEESMSNKYRVKKIPSGRPPKTQTMKLKNCSVESKIARKMFGDSK